MSHPIPSHRSSVTARNERRANWKENVRADQNQKRPVLSPTDALAKFERMATAFVAAGAVSRAGNRYKVRVGNGQKFYPVYLIGAAFKCDCNDFYEYKTCSHAQAAEKFAAREETELLKADMPFRAVLRYGNRKGLDFSKRESFTEKQAAIDWLVREAFNKFQPEGEVTDMFGGVVFEISEEFFELWDEAA